MDNLNIEKDRKAITPNDNFCCRVNNVMAGAFSGTISSHTFFSLYIYFPLTLFASCNNKIVVTVKKKKTTNQAIIRVSKLRPRPPTHCKFQEWQPHLNARVSPVHFCSMCVHSTHSSICNHRNIQSSCRSEYKFGHLLCAIFFYKRLQQNS